MSYEERTFRSSRSENMGSNPTNDGHRAALVAGRPIETAPYCDHLLTKEDLRRALNLPSTRSVDELVRRRVISAIRIGWRTVRFNLAAVLKDLEKVTIRAA
ncbi:MAG: hypothetical protein P4L99_13585 [Chthoniobacter sp.]|nr:hypothetical protein [Chthoniobacter sp.]